MSFIYTQSIFKSRINAGVQGKIGMLINAQDTMNEAVRTVLTDLDIVSTRRRSTLSPNLYNGIFDYTCPTDLKGFSIIDLPGQAKRSDGTLAMIPANEFNIKNPVSAIAIDDYNGVRVLKINSKVDSHSITISELDSLTSGSASATAWSLFGDATSVAADSDDFIKGNGSLKYNISAAGGTTAGIQNAAVNSVDMTDYFGGTSSFFVWAKITSTTDLTNFILRFGTDSSNYYSKTVTAQADGTAFVNGWNLLKFDVSSYSTTGTPTITNIKYFVIYMTKATTKISETDYKFDWLVLKRGVITYLKYYSKYGWQTSSGSYIENSTTTTDVLVADTDEFDLFVKKGRALAARECEFSETQIRQMDKDYDDAMKNYQMTSPSEALNITSEYYTF